MTRRLPFALFVTVATFLHEPSAVIGQITPPADGVALPAAYRRVVERDPHAFQLRRAWLKKTQHARELRRQLAIDGATDVGLQKIPGATVQGEFRIPVFTTKFSDTAAAPYPASDLRTSLFGPNPAGLTLSDFYYEISYGKVATTGELWDWHALPQTDDYYAGESNGTDPNDAKVGELIRDVLDANDASVDFGLYDNDGPDGFPNSGDDDGFVDFVAFVHPETGGECGANDNIWSHRWVYRAWDASGGLPYRTDDPAANGGEIFIDDYTIQPSYSCFGQQQPIEIGVFCHEFGHAFGLPDLYDVNGGSEGLGHWGLMASGSWNQPESPAHMSAWSKRELGWVNSVPVSWQGTVISVPPVETDPVIYDLSFTDQRWRRRDDCALVDSWSLAMGLTIEESDQRGWVLQQGYGNLWRETVAHDFTYDGQGEVVLSFQYTKASESPYDYTYLFIEVDGQETLLRAYGGEGEGNESIPLTSHLVSEPVDYRLKFRFVSNWRGSNEDGQFFASCAPFVIDELSVQGGGENYAATFEDHVEGWFQPRNLVDNPISERWLIENRQSIGADDNLHGTGLLIYHVDDEVASSMFQNTGGYTNQNIRGVVVEEADGFDQLLEGMNRGDAGDIWPGQTGKLQFNGGTYPNTQSNSGGATPVAITGIQADGSSMLATVVAGDPAPVLTDILPSRVDGTITEVEISFVGIDHVMHGATLSLLQGGVAEQQFELVWYDRDVVELTLDPSVLPGGVYDVALNNPDGQSVLLEGAFDVFRITSNPEAPSRPAANVLSQNLPNPFNPSTLIRYEIAKPGHVSLTVHDARGRRVRTLVAESRTPGHYEARWNGRDDNGTTVASGLYFYRLEAGDFSAQRKMLLLK